MTLLIDNLISLLEKDNINKDSFDNTKVLYDNLLKLINKNIEDFITPSEALQKTVNIREEQDKIARNVQYNYDENGEIIIEKTDDEEEENAPLLFVDVNLGTNE